MKDKQVNIPKYVENYSVVFIIVMNLFTNV